MSKPYTREDVEFHSDGFRSERPAVNVKVYTGIQEAWRSFEREEPEHDPRFSLEWIEENLSDDVTDYYFVPLQMLSTIYINAFAWWADEQDDSAAYNAEAPVDLCISHA